MGSTATIRRAAHAGSWYSADPRELCREVDGMLDVRREVSGEDTAARSSGGVIGVIAPHAGLRYSGVTAGHAYARLLEAARAAPTPPRRVVVLGPSHHVALRTAAVPDASVKVLECPLGNLRVDTDGVEALVRAHPSLFSRMSVRVDEDEHSLEMHFPFIARVWTRLSVPHDAPLPPVPEEVPGLVVLPIMIGATSAATEAAIAAAIRPLLASADVAAPSASLPRAPASSPARCPTALVVSSDWCHWGQRFGFTPGSDGPGPYHTVIEELDKQGMRIVSESGSSPGVASAFRSYLSSSGNTVCGRHPIGVLLELGCRVHFVKYARSCGAVRSLSESSVSYAAAVIES